MPSIDDTITTTTHGDPAFIPGVQLCELFYQEAVKPILATAFPSLRYSAALIGAGSDVLGYDTVRSTDHDWGPRLILFVTQVDYEDSATRIHDVLRERLPRLFRGYSVHFGTPDAQGIRVAALSETGLVEHKVEVSTPERFCRERLGVDPRGGLSLQDWLMLSQQKLLEFTAGRVFHDGLGALGEIRDQLAYYPRDVWLYLLAAQWQRISQQEAFVGRTGEVGDELGSQLVAGTLVRDLMRLCFLMERRYAPYSKWFGTAFSRLDTALALTPSLQGALRAVTWQERERHLCNAYEAVAHLHNGLGITEPLAERVSPFHGRPFQVIHGGHFVTAIINVIEDQAVRDLVTRVGVIGSIDQISDNVDVVSYPEHVVKLRALYA